MRALEDRNSSLIKVLKLWNKTLKDHEEDVERIRNWISIQPHLTNVPSYELISNTLIKSKFSLEKTKQTLDYYYTIRCLMPEVFDRSNERINRILHLVANKKERIVPMPKLTEEGYRVTYGSLSSDPKELDPYDMINHRCAIFEIRYIKDCAVGDIIIEDLSGIQLGHIKLFTPMIIKKFSLCYETVYNNRIRAIHFINMPGYFETVFNMIKRILKPKLAERTFSHRNADNLKKILPLQQIPEEYGGTGPKLTDLQEIWRKELENFKPTFEELDKLRSEENKRPTALVNDDILGYFGSFKQINLD